MTEVLKPHHTQNPTTGNNETYKFPTSPFPARSKPKPKQPNNTNTNANTDPKTTTKPKTKSKPKTKTKSRKDGGRTKAPVDPGGHVPGETHQESAIARGRRAGKGGVDPPSLASVSGAAVSSPGDPSTRRPTTTNTRCSSKSSSSTTTTTSSSSSSRLQVLEKQARTFFRLAKVCDRKETHPGRPSTIPGEVHNQSRHSYSHRSSRSRRSRSSGIFFFRVYRNVFSGSETIDSMLRSGLVESRDEAVRLGNELAHELNLFSNANPLPSETLANSAAARALLMGIGGGGSSNGNGGVANDAAVCNGGSGSDAPVPSQVALFIDNANAFYRFGPGILRVLDKLDDSDRIEDEPIEGAEDEDEDNEPRSSFPTSPRAHKRRSTGTTLSTAATEDTSFGSSSDGSNSGSSSNSNSNSNNSNSNSNNSNKNGSKKGKTKRTKRDTQGSGGSKRGTTLGSQSPTRHPPRSPVRTPTKQKVVLEDLFAVSSSSPKPSVVATATATATSTATSNHESSPGPSGGSESPRRKSGAKKSRRKSEAGGAVLSPRSNPRGATSKSRRKSEPGVLPSRASPGREGILLSPNPPKNEDDETNDKGARGKSYGGGVLPSISPRSGARGAVKSRTAARMSESGVLLPCVSLADTPSEIHESTVHERTGSPSTSPVRTPGSDESKSTKVGVESSGGGGGSGSPVTRERLVASIQKRLTTNHAKKQLVSYELLMGELRTKLSKLYTGDHTIVEAIGRSNRAAAETNGGEGNNECLVGSSSNGTSNGTSISNSNGTGTGSNNQDDDFFTGPDSLDDIITSSAILPSTGDDEASVWTEFIMGKAAAAAAKAKEANQARESPRPETPRSSRASSATKKKKKNQTTTTTTTTKLPMIPLLDEENARKKPSQPKESKSSKAKTKKKKKTRAEAIPGVAKGGETELDRETSRNTKGLGHPEEKTETTRAETRKTDESKSPKPTTPKKKKKKKTKTPATKTETETPSETERSKKGNNRSWNSPAPLDSFCGTSGGVEKEKSQAPNSSEEIDLSAWAMNNRKNEMEWNHRDRRETCPDRKEFSDTTNATDDIEIMLEREQERERQSFHNRHRGDAAPAKKPNKNKQTTPKGTAARNESTSSAPSETSTDSILGSFRSCTTKDSNDLARVRLNHCRNTPRKIPSLLGDDKENEEDGELVYREHYVIDEFGMETDDGNTDLGVAIPVEKHRNESEPETEKDCPDGEGRVVGESPSPLFPQSSSYSERTSSFAESSSSSSSSGIMEAIEKDQFYRLAQCGDEIRAMLPPKRKKTEALPQASEPSLPPLDDIESDEDVADDRTESHYISCNYSYQESDDEFDDEENDEDIDSDDESYMELTVSDAGTIYEEIEEEVVLEEEVIVSDEQSYYEEVTVVSEMEPSFKANKASSTPDLNATVGIDMTLPPRRRISRLQSARYLPPVPEVGPEMESDPGPVRQPPKRKNSVYVEIHSMPDDDDMTQITMDDGCFLNSSLSSNSLNIIPEDDYTINNGGNSFNSYLYPLEEEQDVDQDCDTTGSPCGDNNKTDTTMNTELFSSDYTTPRHKTRFPEEAQRVLKKRLSSSTPGSSVLPTETSRDQIDKTMWQDLVSADTTVVLEALKVLHVLVSTEVQSRSYLLRHGGVMAIIKTMEKRLEVEAAQFLCCSILSFLASLDSEISLTIFERNGISLVEDSLKKHSNSRRLKKMGNSLLEMLSSHS